MSLPECPYKNPEILGLNPQTSDVIIWCDACNSKQVGCLDLLELELCPEGWR